MRSRVNFLFIFFSLAILLFPTALFAQSLDEILFGPGNKNNYMGQYDFKGKRKNGYGIERYRNGNIYVGDFNKGKVAGRGMLLALDKGIPNVENAVVYVGNWVDGKKEGKGVCYDSSGKVVYKGSFSNDKPLTSSTTRTEQNFSTIEMGEELYVGETIGKRPNGYGLKLCKNGAIVFGVFKNGAIRGVCMTLFSPDNWEVGQWVDGKYRPFNNSTEANSRTSEYLTLTAEHRKQVRAELFTATMNFANSAVDLAVTIKENRNVRSGNVYSESLTDASSSNSSKSNKSSKAGKCKYCGGSGNCSPASSSGRKNACHGSGLCGYCNGTGWIKAGGSEAKCTACNGNKKCKSCRGSGDCRHCNGTGQK